jgi:GNAT superfamily N-acetyltransferase
MLRPVSVEDCNEVVRLARAMHKESKYKKLPFDEQKIVTNVYACALHPDQMLGLVEEMDGRLVGMFQAYMSSLIFNDSLIAVDSILYVEKKYRGTMVAIKFLKAYEDWAKRNNAVQIFMGISTGIHEARTVQLYKRLGYKQSGIVLTK